MCYDEDNEKIYFFNFKNKKFIDLFFYFLFFQLNIFLFLLFLFLISRVERVIKKLRK